MGLRVVFPLLVLLFSACRHASDSGPVSHTPDGQAFCSNFVGLDVKALQSEKFPKGVLPIALQGVKCPIVSFPWHTFGTSNSAIDELFNLADVGEMVVRVDLYNATCLRNEKLGCHDGDLFQNLTPARLSSLLEARNGDIANTFRARIREIRAFFEKSPSFVSPLISFGLEDNLSAEATQALKLLIDEEWPGVELVSNPMTGVRDDGAEHRERHGVNAKCDELFDVISQDGGSSDGVDSDRAFLRDSDRRCFARLLWRPEWQGRKRDGAGGVTSTSEAPRERTPEFTEVEAQEVNRLLLEASE